MRIPEFEGQAHARVTALAGMTEGSPTYLLRLVLAGDAKAFADTPEFHVTTYPMPIGTRVVLWWADGQLQLDKEKQR